MKKIHFTSLKFIVAIGFSIMISCNTNESKDIKDDNNSNDIDTVDTPSDTSEISKKEDLSKLLDEKDVSELNDAQLKVQELLRYSVNKDYAAFSKTLAYIGEDESRMYKDHFNYEVSEEKEVVKITLDVIKNWLGKSADYEFISYENSPSEIGVIHSVEILFKKEGIGVDRKFFRLKESNDKGMLLISID